MEYYNKLLIQKTEQLNLYKKQMTVIYLMSQDKSLIYYEYDKPLEIYDEGEMSASTSIIEVDKKINIILVIGIKMIL